jgi:hypothetical protein
MVNNTQELAAQAATIADQQTQLAALTTAITELQNRQANPNLVVTQEMIQQILGGVGGNRDPKLDSGKILADHSIVFNQGGKLPLTINIQEVLNTIYRHLILQGSFTMEKVELAFFNWLDPVSSQKLSALLKAYQAANEEHILELLNSNFREANIYPSRDKEHFEKSYKRFSRFLIKNFITEQLQRINTANFNKFVMVTQSPGMSPPELVVVLENYRLQSYGESQTLIITRATIYNAFHTFLGRGSEPQQAALTHIASTARKEYVNIEQLSDGSPNPNAEGLHRNIMNKLATQAHDIYRVKASQAHSTSIRPAINNVEIDFGATNPLFDSQASEATGSGAIDNGIFNISASPPGNDNLSMHATLHNTVAQVAQLSDRFEDLMDVLNNNIDADSASSDSDSDEGETFESQCCVSTAVMNNVTHSNQKALGEKGACFKCGKQGHWRDDCPDRDKGTPTRSGTFNYNSRFQRSRPRHDITPFRSRPRHDIAPFKRFSSMYKKTDGRGKFTGGSKSGFHKRREQHERRSREPRADKPYNKRYNLFTKKDSSLHHISSSKLDGESLIFAVDVDVVKNGNVTADDVLLFDLA